MLMLNLYPPAGKHVLITAAGSDCASLLGQWALRCGALSVTGVYRSAIHAQTLIDRGIYPLEETHTTEIQTAAQQAGIVYDATGGALAELLLSSMAKSARFVSYGLLSGKPYSLHSHFPSVQWFHIRNVLDTLSPLQWQALFIGIWAQLRQSHLNDAAVFPLSSWKDAITFYSTAGRMHKPVLAFPAQ